MWKDSYKSRGAPMAWPNGAATGPRGAPAVADGKVCTFGVGGTLSCVDANSGKVLWRKDTGAKPKFYAACSPLITGKLCLTQTGSDKGEPRRRSTSAPGSRNGSFPPTCALSPVPLR